MRNNGLFEISGDAGGLDIGAEIGSKVVVARHGVRLAALLAQPHPDSAVLRVHILDLHP